MKSLGALSEKELRAIELEENLRRKDLTEIEKSRNMVELAAIKASTFDAVRQKPQKGRPPKAVVSEEELAKEIGVPRTTLREAEQHVEAVEKYPELEKLPKKTIPPVGG